VNRTAPDGIGTTIGNGNPFGNGLSIFADMLRIRAYILLLVISCHFLAIFLTAQKNERGRSK
jgi:hypothetical protein